MLTVDESSNGQDVELGVGQELEVCLRENPTTGYQWRLAAGAMPACQLIKDFPEAPGEARGSGRTRRWLFRGAQAGGGTIQLVLRRSWEPQAERTFTLLVRVVS
jgi:inhibitor of cysteine peptidase